MRMLAAYLFGSLFAIGVALYASHMVVDSLNHSTNTMFKIGAP